MMTSPPSLMSFEVSQARDCSMLATRLRWVSAAPLLSRLHRPASSLALVQDPASLATIPLLQPLLARLVGAAGAAGPLPALVVGSDGGPLLAAASGDRWLLGTAADRPETSALEAALAADGLIAAPLEFDGHPLLVWTRLQAGPGRRRCWERRCRRCSRRRSSPRSRP